jgi:sugar-specific transcriptional regulator TrmB
MVIIVELEHEITEYLKKSISRIIDSNIDIKIAIKEDVEKVATSYDFIYSETQKVGIYKNGQDRACYFKVTKDMDTIRNLSYDFDNIKKAGYSLDEFMNKNIKKQWLKPISEVYHFNNT